MVYYQHARAGLPTPPEMYGYGYHHNTAGATQYNQQQAKKSAYDSVNYAPTTVPMMYDHPSMHYSNLPPISTSGMQNSAYGPIAAPILPPPMSDRNMGVHGHAQAQAQAQAQQQHHEQRAQQQQQPAAKQEKVTGGVSQTLDYEMDQMTDYVAEMAQSMYAAHEDHLIKCGVANFRRSVIPGSVSPTFRKFVAGLLSSTRLPSSTILLGLNYLARRMNMLNNPTPRKPADGQLWRMLTIALLLGSKFLDDNTFQNRSWSEVSGIPVIELNTLEKEWLKAIEFRLHVDPLTDSDFQSWLASWANWKETKNKQHKATLDRLAPLAPIDVNVNRYHSQHKTYTPDPYNYPHHDTFAVSSSRPQSCYEPAWVQGRSSHEQLSPPSAPESGPTTPEYMMLPNSGLPPTDWYGYDAFYNRRSQIPAANASYALPQGEWVRDGKGGITFSRSQTQTPAHGYQHQGIWGHAAGCGCGYCGRPHESYFMGPSYGPQTVVG